MIEPETFLFEGDGEIPNSRLPLLVYRAALPADLEVIERCFAANNWPPAWLDSVHSYHHFHSNTHEVLGVTRSKATVQFGGAGGPEATIAAGDVVVIPAGVGHRNSAHTPDLMIDGAYPGNAPRSDQYRGNPADYTAVLARIAEVLPPWADPVSRADGPLCRLWSSI